MNDHLHSAFETNRNILHTYQIEEPTFRRAFPSIKGKIRQVKFCIPRYVGEQPQHPKPSYLLIETDEVQETNI